MDVVATTEELSAKLASCASTADVQRSLDKADAELRGFQATHDQHVKFLAGMIAVVRGQQNSQRLDMLAKEVDETNQKMDQTQQEAADLKESLGSPLPLRPLFPLPLRPLSRCHPLTDILGSAHKRRASESPSKQATGSESPSKTPVSKTPDVDTPWYGLGVSQMGVLTEGSQFPAEKDPDQDQEERHRLQENTSANQIGVQPAALEAALEPPEEKQQEANDCCVWWQVPDWMVRTRVVGWDFPHGRIGGWKASSLADLIASFQSPPLLRLCSP